QRQDGGELSAPGGSKWPDLGKCHLSPKDVHPLQQGPAAPMAAAFQTGAKSRPAARDSTSEQQEQYLAPMRYRLRTLLILTTIGPPLLATLWLSIGDWELVLHSLTVVGLVVIALGIAYLLVMAAIWLFCVIAEKLVRLLMR